MLWSLPKRFLLLTWGYAHCHWATPSCPGPGGLKSPVWKICKIALPCPLGSHIQVILGLHGGNYVQAEMKGQEELGCRVTKPWQTQPITFFSWLSKDLTHREDWPPYELVKGRDGAGRVVLGLTGTSTCPPSRSGQGAGWCRFR